MRIPFLGFFGEDLRGNLTFPAALLKLIYARLQTSINLYQQQSRPALPHQNALPIKVGKSRDSDLPSPQP